MARVTIDVPDNVLEESKSKELVAARKRIKVLEAKIAKLEETHAEAKAAAKAFQDFRSIVAESLDLYTDYGF